MLHEIDDRLAQLRYDPQHFRDVAESEIGVALWNFLTRSDTVIRLETASYLERAAVEPIGPYLLAEFGPEVAEDRLKQTVGHMVRQVMEQLGYELVQPGVRMVKGMFTTGARYQLPAEQRDRAMKITREQRQAWLERTAASPFNVWLNGQVRDTDGKLNLDRLYSVAAQYGISGREGYAHLNPGQQRMTVGIKLRTKVPSSVFEAL